MLIKIKRIIRDINEYQTGALPRNAIKIDTQTMEEMMKKSAPIAVVLCLVMASAMFFKTFFAQAVVFEPIFAAVGFIIGFALLIVHELLHAVIYPKEAEVTIGRLKGKLVFLALVSYPLKRDRFILMSLFPFILGIIPLCIFIFTPPEYKAVNGIMFGMACMGMVSPYPDVYNVITVLRKAEKTDKIMFYQDDMYKIR